MNFSYGGWPVWEGNFKLKNTDFLHKGNTKIVAGKVQVLFPANREKLGEFITPDGILSNETFFARAIVTTKNKSRFVVRIKPAMANDFFQDAKNTRALNISGLALMEEYGLDNIFIMGNYYREDFIEIKLIKLSGKMGSINYKTDIMGEFILEKTNEYNLSCRSTGVLCSIQ